MEVVISLNSGKKAKRSSFEGENETDKYMRPKAPNIFDIMIK